MPKYHDDLLLTVTAINQWAASEDRRVFAAGGRVESSRAAFRRAMSRLIDDLEHQIFGGP
ncbi:hypothetical protein SEA_PHRAPPUCCINO_169 [Mycobacterium phage Phrappuccino]|uniref:Uncharacterized protein n=1 Tax=Mycobacterium phage Phrappuccino TaxID=2591223 RepID=A0A514DE07_9CAUD|nr:hypothetical protein KHQ87_gp169 [Mycobacterium phage Phrappuccino]QDH91844.1 hypothetical protein SEA_PHRAPPUCCINO_169 [Mycobacterium phage Phrappuccino]QIQ63345.1 hypothetical protein SEA_SETTECANDELA_169 [Mycobacterium phage Settecandela]